MIPSDKYGHFGVGAIIGLSALWLGWWAVLPLLTIAAGKEAWDHAHPPHRAEALDILATMLGGLLAIALVILRYGHGLMLAMVALFLLTGCGTKRDEVRHQESEAKTVIKTTTIAEKQVATPEGPAVVETIKTVTYSEEVRTATVDDEVNSMTTVHAPEITAAISGAGNMVAPGLGTLLSGAMRWLTGTPEGAAAGLCAGTLVAGLTKRSVEKGKEAKQTRQRADTVERHFKAVVKGNSDFMQANPDQAEKLKAAQRSAQVDPALKASVIQARVDQGQV